VRQIVFKILIFLLSPFLLFAQNIERGSNAKNVKEINLNKDYYF